MSIIYVNQQSSGGEGTSWESAYRSLQDAIASARNGDEIWVASGTYTPGTSQDDSFAIEAGVSIYGGFVGTEEERRDRNYTDNLTILSGAREGSRNFNVVDVQSSEQVRLDGVIVQGGDATGSALQDAGGIYNRSNSDLLLENVIVQDNVASDDGGGIRNDGELIVLNSTIADNQANGTAQTTGGGGLLNSVGATATIIGSTFSGNASLRGGAIRNDGTLSLINSTLSGNDGGGLLNTTTNPLSATATAGQATIVGSTITLSGGSGIDNFGSVTLANSLIAGNNNGDNDLAAFAFGRFESNGNNLIGDRGTASGFNDSDIVGEAGDTVDPLLGDLQNNGGFTETHQLTEKSPAVDAGSDDLTETDTLDIDGDSDTSEAIPFDQRGESFDRVVGASVDIGAVEFSSEPDSTSTEEENTGEENTREEGTNTEGNNTQETDPPEGVSTSDNFARVSIVSAASDQSSDANDFVLQVDEQGRVVDIEIGELNLSGINIGGFSLGELDIDSIDFSGINENVSLFSDLFGRAEGALSNLQLDLFEGLTLSRTEQIPDGVSEALRDVLNVALPGFNLDTSLFNEALDSFIEQLQERDAQVSFQLRSDRAAFDGLLFSAELGQGLLPIGTALQGFDEPELIDLRDISEAETLTATFEVYREAAFDNQVGFFEIEDVTGQVLDADGNLIGVGDDGYVLAAMQRRIETNLTTSNGETSTYTAQITGGKLLSSFIVSNGSIEALLDDDAGNNPDVFFSHMGANSDRTDHVRLLGDNTFGYEDLAGGGDRDFNDLIVKASFESMAS